MTRPLLLVDGLYQPGDRPAVRVHLAYLEALDRAGGTPLLLGPEPSPAARADALARADGLLLTGGDDFVTEALGLGPTHPAAVPTPLPKQEFDLDLARHALADGLPVLGICYGMQALGLVEGAGFLQHLPEDRPGCQEHRNGARHVVHPQVGSKLANATGPAPFEVVSRHHQALDGVPAPWRVVARDEEGLVEAIEHATHPFALGVQWHPELSPDHSASRGLFDAFVEAARARAQDTPSGAPTR